MPRKLSILRLVPLVSPTSANSGPAGRVDDGADRPAIPETDDASQHFLPHPCGWNVALCSRGTRDLRSASAGSRPG